MIIFQIKIKSSIVTLQIFMYILHCKSYIFKFEISGNTFQDGYILKNDTIK